MKKQPDLPFEIGLFTFEKKKTDILSDVRGTPEGIRTPDLLVRSQTLYPAELRAQKAVLIKILNSITGQAPRKLILYYKDK